MTAKEKAKELVEKFRVEVKDMMMHGDGGDEIFYAKRCALICVDEILESHYKVLIGVMPKVYNYWKEVEQEINEL